MNSNEKTRALLHDVMNKLTLIMGNGCLFRRNSCRDCPNARFMDVVLAASSTIDEMVNAYRRELTLIQYQEEPPYALGAELTGCLGDFIKQQGIVHGIETEVINKVSADCLALGSRNHDSNGRSLIQNCIANAKNANATKITLTWVESDSYVTCHFSDNGDGMTEEQVELAGLIRPGHEGTTIIKRLAYEMGGIVQWSSAGYLAGSTVSVRVPKFQEIKNA